MFATNGGLNAFDKMADMSTSDITSHFVINGTYDIAK